MSSFEFSNSLFNSFLYLLANDLGGGTSSQSLKMLTNGMTDGGLSGNSSSSSSALIVMDNQGQPRKPTVKLLISRLFTISHVSNSSLRNIYSNHKHSSRKCIKTL